MASTRAQLDLIGWTQVECDLTVGREPTIQCMSDARIIFLPCGDRAACCTQQFLGGVPLPPNQVRLTEQALVPHQRACSAERRSCSWAAGSGLPAVVSRAGRSTG